VLGVLVVGGPLAGVPAPAGESAPSSGRLRSAPIPVAAPAARNPRRVTPECDGRVMSLPGADDGMDRERIAASAPARPAARAMLSARRGAQIGRIAQFYLLRGELRHVGE
jgi:hypothetical protein